ncbi:fibronectin type III domain-containing protein [Aquimarina pacifica]|uniref:fibronectin type III domain-containing protein n=1 Tax=Aquimarina pacifica TaxID=1296415 RepID=UPI000472D856|nr:fibronectin type III domain-containing protein [Aquimarina pacifica]
MKRILLYFLLLFSCGLITAQIYPVQVTPQLIPPHSLKLSDYQTTASEKLFVNLLLTDVNEIGRRVRLKMKIQGQGLNIETIDFVSGASPIFLDGGINTRLSNLDLRPYFDLNNLQGISPQQYSETLPEGSYNFCFEVYDYLSGQLFSRQNSCFNVYLLLNDPPFLNLPNTGDLITAQNPQNIIFNWTPRHLNATNVQYEFTLKELWDTGMNPQAAFVVSPALYQTTTLATTLLYGPAETQLLEDKTYGWQVRAIVSDGVSETSVFRNNGNSEIYYFNYQADCKAPEFIISQAQNSQTVAITWQTSEHLRYETQYRKKGYTDDDDWFTSYAYNPETTIRNLEGGTTYEFRVGGECTPNGGFAFSQTQEFTTPTEEETAYYNCGVLPEIEITNQDPLQNIGVNEIFTAGDFPVTVKEISGSNGVYSGWGYISVPYLALVKIRVEFDSITINSDYQLTNGIVKTSYDANWEGIANIDDAIEEVFGDTGDIDKFDASTIDIAYVEVDENGNVTLIDEQGVAHPIETDTPVVITDANGDQWTVDEAGNVTEGKEADGGTPTAGNTNGITNSGNVTQISATDVAVFFNTSGFYGTDKLRGSISDTDFANSYETIEQANGGKYNVLYKVISDVAEHEEDFMTATATLSNGKTTDDIIFKTIEGTSIPAEWNGNTATIALTKRFDFGKEEILANIKPENSTGKYDIAGKVNVWHITKQLVNITLVPINGASISSSIANEINAIYNKTGVDFNITTAPSLTINTGTWDVETSNGTLDIGDSSVLAHYTAEERTIYEYYKEQRGVESEMYYVFVLGDDIPTSDPETEGFMPLKRQYGFVFNPEHLTKTIAHELGHGIYGLEHPFTEYGVQQETTDLLMDYGSGMEFTHMDWQKIHAPGIQLYLFQNDEDGESVGISRLSDLDDFKNELDGSYSFLSPSGEIITLPNTTSSVYFSTGDTYGDTDIVAPLGSLICFVDKDGQIYTHKIGEISEKSKGFGRKKGSGVYEPYVDELTDKIGKENISPILGKLCLNATSSGFIFQVTSITYSSIEEYIKESIMGDTILVASDEHIQSIDFINNLFLESTKIKLLETSNDESIVKEIQFSLGKTFDNELVQKYIIRNSENAQCDSPYSPYIIGLSKLITKYPNIHILSNTTDDHIYEDEENKRIIQERFNILKSIQDVYESGNITYDYHNISPNENNTPHLNIYASYFKTYAIAASGYSKFYESLQTNNLAKTKEAFTNLKGSEFTLKQLTYEERFRLLNKIIENPAEIDEYQDLLIALLCNTPSEQLQQWYDDLSLDSNTGDIMIIYKTLGEENKEYFVNFLVQMQQKINPAPLILPSTLPIKTADLVLPDGEMYFYRENYFNVHNTDVLSDCKGILTATPPCKIFFTEQKDVQGFSPFESNTIRFGYLNAMTQSNQVKASYTFYDGNPLTSFVRIDFLDEFNYAGIKAGDSKVVPLIWAYHFAHKHNERIEGLKGKIAMATFGILSAPFGGSSVIIALDIILNVGTIAIAINDDTIQATNEGKEFIKLWDKAIATYGLVMGGKALFDLSKEGTKQIYSVITKDGQFTKSLKDLSKTDNGITKLDELKDSYNDAIQHAKSISNNPEIIQFENIVDQSFKEAEIINSIKQGFDNTVLEVKNYEVLKIGDQTIATLKYQNNTKQILVVDFDTARLADDAVMDGYESVGTLAVNTKKSEQVIYETVEVFRKTATGDYFVKTAVNSFDYVDALIKVSSFYISSPLFENHASAVLESLLESAGVEDNKNKALELTKLLKTSWGVFKTIQKINNGINRIGEETSESIRAAAMARAIDKQFSGKLNDIIANKTIIIEGKTYEVDKILEGFIGTELRMIVGNNKKSLDEAVKKATDEINTIVNSPKLLTYNMGREVVKDYPSLLTDKNYGLINEISNRFIYKQKLGFDGLNEFFHLTKSSRIRSLSQLFKNLNQAKTKFGSNTTVKFEPIKEGEIKIIDNNGKEIARFIDGILHE